MMEMKSLQPAVENFQFVLYNECAIIYLLETELGTCD